MRCLLVGDGDLSFSLSVAKKWEQEYKEGKRGKWSIVATCFDTKEELLTKYRHAGDILRELEEVRERTVALGCLLEALSAVDATCIPETLERSRADPNSQLLKAHDRCGYMDGRSHGQDGSSGVDKEEFDRIVFQFPHRGGKNFMGKNRALLKMFFHSASGILKDDHGNEVGCNRGEVIVTLLVGQGGTDFERLSLGSSHVPDSRRLTKRVHGDHWQLTEMAAESGLILTPMTAFFDPRDYPDYRPRGYRNTLDNAAKGFTLDYSVSHVLSTHFDIGTSVDDLALAAERENHWSRACELLERSLLTAVQGCHPLQGKLATSEGLGITVSSTRPSQNVNRTRVPMAVASGMEIRGVDTRLHCVDLAVDAADGRLPSVSDVASACEDWLSSLFPHATISTVPGGDDEAYQGKVTCKALTFLSAVEEEAVSSTILTREGTAFGKFSSEQCRDSLVVLALSHHQFTCASPLELQVPLLNLERVLGDQPSLHLSLCIETMVMTLLGLPTLQCLWSLDRRIARQVEAALLSLGEGRPHGYDFKPVSILQHTLERQVCFWLPSDYTSSESQWGVEEFNAFLQEHYQGDLVRVCLKSDYERSPTKRSHNYRLTFWSPHSALADSKITILTNELYTLLPEKFGVSMR